MTTMHAITNDVREELSGEDVIISDGKIARCPSCGATNIPTTENKEFGLTFVGYHPAPGTTSYCEHSGVPLKFSTTPQQEEQE